MYVLSFVFCVSLVYLLDCFVVKKPEKATTEHGIGAVGQVATGESMLLANGVNEFVIDNCQFELSRFVPDANTKDNRLGGR